MNMNRALARLLASSGEGVEAPLEFRLLANNLKRVEDCVFFRAFATGIEHVVVDEHAHDRTGYEASINSLHVEDYVEREHVSTSSALAWVAVRCAEYLAGRLRTFSGDRFRVIVSVSSRAATLRFHTLREAESWLADDLETYTDEAIGYIDI
jgi:hypothetical protein